LWRTTSSSCGFCGSFLSLAFISTALWTLSFCGTRQFYVVNENKTWTDAQNYCRENFTDLATIESQEEMNSLVAVLKGKTGHFWIGLIEQYTTSRNCVSLEEVLCLMKLFAISYVIAGQELNFTFITFLKTYH
uniref:C-type lectin domain-containing protein n=1 Tax=Pygocentrus nattereri TaxID=42514 RepID=A0A3B4CB55_PYGNA